MRTPEPLERVTVTVPRHLIQEADRVAAQQGRSRSWVLTQALRQMLAEPDPGATTRSPMAQAVQPDGPDPDHQAAHSRRLTQALRLAPEARLLASEELVRLGRMVRPHRWRRQIVAFDSYEEYAQWKTASRAGA